MSVSKAQSSRSGSSPPPNIAGASSVARLFASEVTAEVYSIKATNAIEECFGHIKCVSALVYIHGGDTEGVLQDAAATTYLGRTSKFLTEVRDAGDQNFPILISETNLGEEQYARCWVKGNAGTKILLIYR